MNHCGIAKKDDPVFTRNISHMVKGVAILMMIAHHCFAFPDYWLDSYCVSPILAEISNHFKICVAVYAFITGYGFFLRGSTPFGASARKLLNFLGQYWMQLFLIFLPIASINFRFSTVRIVYNIFALYDNVIVFAWYVFFHCFAVLTFPFVRKLLKYGPIRDLAMVFAGGYCFTVILYFQPVDAPLFNMLLDCSIYYPVVGVGYLTAKYSVFERVSEKVTHQTAMAILMIVAVFLLRSKVSVIKGFLFDSIYAPMLILALSWILREIRFLQPALTFLGKHSFHMWLFHGIFFSAYTRDVAQPLVAWSNISIIRFMLVTMLSALAAFVISVLWEWFIQVLHRCKKENV